MIGKIFDLWHQWHSMIIFVVVCIILLAVIFTSAKIIKQAIHSLFVKKSKDIKLLQKRWQKSLLIIITLFLLYIIQSLSVIPEEYSDYYSHLLILLTIACCTWGTVQMLYSIRDHIIKRTEKTSNNLSVRAVRTKLNILLKISTVIVTIIGTSFALITFPKIQQIGISVLASAGMAGVILGLAAQKSLGNLLAGIQIAFTQPIKIDDVVFIENEFGYIEEITLTYVVIRIWDQRRLVLPITYFIEKTFQNWTRTSAELIGSIFIHVDYETPLDNIRKALDNILEKTNLWDGKVKSLVVTDTTPQTMEVRVLVSATNSSKLWDLRCYVREQLITFLQKHHPNSLPKTRIQINNDVNKV